MRTNRKSTHGKGSWSKPPFVALLLAVIPTGVPSLAAAQIAAPPSAGSILRQVQPTTPQPAAPPTATLTVEQGIREALRQSEQFLVKTIRIIGNTQVDTATLHALVADAEGQNLTLSQLGELSDRITAYYHNHDSPLSRAIIPPQEVREGTVMIEVIEARYGQVTFDNSSRVNDRLVRDALSLLRSNGAVSQAELDHSLLLLTDIPGAAAGATLKPGASPGTSDLLVDITAGPAITGNAVLDNYGSRYTGRGRISGTVNFINLLHQGDILSLSGLYSDGGINYVRAGYEIALNGQGDRAGASYSVLHYTIGEPLELLDAHGNAHVASLWISHPFMRSRSLNLYGQLQHDELRLRDRIDVAAIKTDRHLRSWTLSLTGDARDAFLSGGVSTWSIGRTQGRVGFDDAAAQIVDTATAQTRGDYSKWNASISRLQGLGSNDELYLAFSGQWADTNLDSAEKMIAGGPFSVRGYDVGAMSGDDLRQGTIELRHGLGSWNGHWQVTAFVDSARVTVNATPWSASPNEGALNGAGMGLNWTGVRGATVRAFVATRIGGAPALVGTAGSARAGLAISAGF
jgi:hemolysin activation/secretion protein